MTSRKKAVWLTGSIVTLLVGVFVIPKLMQKGTGKIYKSSHYDIDFDNLGPEIIKKGNEENIEDGD